MRNLFQISSPTRRASATQSSIVTPSMGMNGSTSSHPRADEPRYASSGQSIPSLCPCLAALLRPPPPARPPALPRIGCGPRPSPGPARTPRVLRSSPQQSRPPSRHRGPRKNSARTRSVVSSFWFLVLLPGSFLGWLSGPVRRKFWFAVRQCRPFVHERWLALAVWRRRIGLGLPRPPPGFQRPLRPDHRLQDRLSRHFGGLSGSFRCFNALLFRRRLRFFLEVALQLPRKPGKSRHPQPHDQRGGSVHSARFEQDKEHQKNHHQKSVKIFLEQPLCSRRRNPQQPHPLDGLLGIVRLGTL